MSEACCTCCAVLRCALLRCACSERCAPAVHAVRTTHACAGCSHCLCLTLPPHLARLTPRASPRPDLRFLPCSGYADAALAALVSRGINVAAYKYK